VKATYRGVARELAIAEQGRERSFEELVQVPRLILLVEQVVREDRDRPAVARPIEVTREPSSA
jgi:hypothetical protein